ncbi:DUF2798 domain-containing protein [Hydrogenophaga sp.]|uniref:DUF2798 domain-containing protein n=1 Tax=Hydrogenophaga sp. TaxID=1904254 RepID=UPI00356B3D21
MQALRTLRVIYPVFLISILISLSVTGLVTYLNTGWDAGFVSRWMPAAGLAIVFVLPMGGVIMALVSRLVAWLVPDHRVWQHRLVFALLMGMSMEAVVTAIATGTNMGLQDGLASAWAHAYVQALPLGLCIGLFMGFVVRPWLQGRIARMSVQTPQPSAA